MKYRALTLILIGVLLLLSLGVYGDRNEWYGMADDADGDGVPDSVDVCPAEDASFFDADGDGCIDEVIGARHIEYWSTDDLPFTYVINQEGVPGITDGSDFTALQAGVEVWAAISGTYFTVSYDGTTAQEDAAILDQINLVTFMDDEYAFHPAVIAVGISTSFTVDSLYNGTWYRPGQIVDADMIFNSTHSFTTPSVGGFGTDVQSVATHEAAHLYGISHTAIRSSTMFYVLPTGEEAASLETDDELVFLKAYPDAATLASANRLSGTVTDGQTTDPVPGAIVFAIDAGSGDTLACDYTMPDGTYLFFGLPDGSYYISIYPLNGTSPIVYLKPENVNALLDSTAVTLFVPEYYDAAESATDNPADMLAVAVSGGAAITGIDIVTNIDATPPEIVEIIPEDEATDIRTDSAIRITFSEAIDISTISGNFELLDTVSSTFVTGTATVMRDDSVLVFVPSSPFLFQTVYRLTLDTGLGDLYGNGLASPYVVHFTTEDIPPLAISSLSPSKGIIGSTVVINGAGFDPTPLGNTVSFADSNATVTTASPYRLVVTVPEGAVTGEVTVQVGMEVSEGVTFTVLSATEIVRGTKVGTTSLGSVPRTVTIVPDGSYAYVASLIGAVAVVADPGQESYLNALPIPIAGGLNDLDDTPDGKRVYGVNRLGQTIHVIDSDPADGPLFNTVLQDLPVLAEPYGIIVEPSGQRAFVPTDDGEIQVWDVQQGSLTQHRQIGVISSPYPGLMGEMAIDPAGEMLLALAGAGKLLVYDLGPDTLLTEISIGSTPRDVVVDPTGLRAYVTDKLGIVTVVNLDGLFKVEDIVTGGALRGISITPAGLYLYTANREFNQIDVIDLNEGNPTFRSVAATISTGLNPVDVIISPDGYYMFHLEEGTNNLVATAIGYGPIITSIAPRAGIEGAKIVIAGEGFGLSAPLIRVFFNELSTSIDYTTGSAVTVTVPSGATSGPVRVQVTPPEIINPIPLYTNAVYFEVLTSTPDPGTLREAAQTLPSGAPDLVPALALSPAGDQALVGTATGGIVFFDTDPESPTFNQTIKESSFSTQPVTDIAITPDGRRAYVSVELDMDVYVVNCDLYDTDYGTVIDTIADYTIGNFDLPREITIAPSGEELIVHDYEADQLYFVDIIEGSENENMVVDTMTFLYNVDDLVYHPAGLYAYIPSSDLGSVVVIDMNPLSGTYRRNVGSVVIPMPPPDSMVAGEPVSVSFFPDGSRCLVLAQHSGTYERYLHVLDTSDPANPDHLYQTHIASVVSLGGGKERIDVSPRGDRAVLHVNYGGIRNVQLTSYPYSVVNAFTDNVLMFQMEHDFVPDGSRFYSVASSDDSLVIFDFNVAQFLSEISGNYQTGVINQILAAPLRVRVTRTGLLPVPVSGVPITFEVTSGGGIFPATGTETQVVATDEQGYAEVVWQLGGELGPSSQSVQAVSQGLTGSPRIFTASSVEDPLTLPLTISEVLPVSGATGVSVTTALLATFSRPVDSTTVKSTSFYLHEDVDPTPVSALIGFTDGTKKVSLMPFEALDFTSNYVLEYTSDILDEAGDTLYNPGSSTFSTQDPPPLVLASVNPPAASVGVNIVLSGAGFDPTPGNNTVLFNDEAVVPTASGVNYIKATVPSGAQSGTVSVAVGTDTSNALPFNVLVKSTSTYDEVVATVGTGSASKSIAVTPDGALAYSVSPDADVVIPIDISGQSAMSSIAVGDQPIAIDIHPEGTYAYTANFGSGSVSIIDVDAQSPDFNTVDSTLLVGTGPVDIAVSADGAQIYVANAGSSSLSIIDGDDESATHHQVVATVGTGSAAKSIAVTPDGTRIYVGTDIGYIVVETVSYGVVATVGTGSSSKSIAVTPDGALLIILTTSGEILIIDVLPGSATENSVVATVGSGSSSKSIAVTPDGGLLYVIQEESDVVLVYSLEITGSVTVIDPGTNFPPPRVDVMLVDSITVGEDSEEVAFDPTGSGLALITNPGEKTVTFIYTTEGPPGDVPAEVRVFPRILENYPPYPRWWKGRYIESYIELPPGFSPGDIDIGTVRMQDVIPAEQGSVTGDTDHDGVLELGVTFDRILFEEIMPIGWVVPVTVSGEADGQQFIGETSITTIRPLVTHPAGGEVLGPGVEDSVTWISPEGYTIDSVDVHWTPNDGGVWLPIALGVPDEGRVQWTTPTVSTDSARALVTLYAVGNDIGAGLSHGIFALDFSVEVTLASFEGHVEAGEAVLTWRTEKDGGIEGFHVLRSDEEGGQFERITTTIIPGRTGSEAPYAYRDGEIRANTTYYYKLQVMASGKDVSIVGLCSVHYTPVFNLGQNMPNPFNPETTIHFSIPEDGNVDLIIYDVAGRRIRTLVDGHRRAGGYGVQWDGKNNEGRFVSSGIYFYRLKTRGHEKTRKMVLLR